MKLGTSKDSAEGNFKNIGAEEEERIIAQNLSIFDSNETIKSIIGKKKSIEFTCEADTKENCSAIKDAYKSLGYDTPRGFLRIVHKKKGGIYEYQISVEMKVSFDSISYFELALISASREVGDFEVYWGFDND